MERLSGFFVLPSKAASEGGTAKVPPSEGWSGAESRALGRGAWGAGAPQLADGPRPSASPLLLTTACPSVRPSVAHRAVQLFDGLSHRVGGGLDRRGIANPTFFEINVISHFFILGEFFGKNRIFYSEKKRSSEAQ